MTTTDTKVEADGGRPALPIDPRIRARRVQVKRDEGRRRLRFLIATSSVVVAVGLAALATRSPLLDIDHLGVVGATHSTQSRVLAAAHLHRGVAMTDVQSGRAARRIERLPWVRSAHLVKRWPATVEVTVTERVPVALARSGEAWALTDRQGRVLEAGRGAGPALPFPVLVGSGPLGRPGTNLPAAWSDAVRVATGIPEALRGAISSIATTDAGELELHLLPAGTVRFGPASDVATKLSSLATLLPQLKLRPGTVIDVRVPDAPAVTPG